MTPSPTPSFQSIPGGKTSPIIEKRVVLRITQGRWAGLSQICGVAPETGAVATFETGIQCGDGPGEASMIAVTPRQVIFRQYKPELLGVRPNADGGNNLFDRNQR